MTDPLIRSLELLAGVTPGPWRYLPANELNYAIIQGPELPDTVCNWRYDTYGKEKADATFIAESPTLVAELCEELKLAREIIADAVLWSETIRMHSTDYVQSTYEDRLRYSVAAYQALIAKRGGGGVKLEWFKVGDEIPKGSRWIRWEMRRENVKRHRREGFSPLDDGEDWETWDNVEYHLYEVMG
jgi:hypothetical protein